MRLSGQLPITAIAILGLLAATLGGCSSGAAFPTLPGLDGWSQKTLTPAEQQAKIKELAAAQGGASGEVQPAVLTRPAATQ